MAFVAAITKRIRNNESPKTSHRNVIIRVKKRRMRRWVTYMALVVHLVIRQLDPIEADDLPHPRLPRTGGVRVDVEPGGDAGVVRVPGHHPLRAVVHVPAGARA